MKRLFAVLTVVLLTGCASIAEGPSATSVTVPSTFAYAPPQESRAPLSTLLPNEDPAFRALLTSVDTDSPDLQVALARVDAARAALRAAGAARAPNIEAIGNAAYSRSSENAVTNLPPGFAIDPTNSSFPPGSMRHGISTCLAGCGRRNARQAFGWMLPMLMPVR